MEFIFEKKLGTVYNGINIHFYTIYGGMNLGKLWTQSIIQMLTLFFASYYGIGNQWIYPGSYIEAAYSYERSIQNEVSKPYQNTSLVVHDGWAYYAQQEVGDLAAGLYRIKLDGTEKWLVEHGQVRNLHIHQERIFYTLDEKGGCIFSAELDGSDKKQISEDRAGFLFFREEQIYYSSGDDGNSLYRMDLNGNQRAKLNQEESIWIQGDQEYIYYADPQGGIYRLRPEDGQKERISDDMAAFLTVEKGRIYYSNMGEGATITSIGIDGGSKMRITDTPGFWIQVESDVVFFADDIKGSLYKINIDGSKKTNVASEIEGEFYLTTEWTYFITTSSGSEEPALYRRSRDGTKQERIKEANLYYLYQEGKVLGIFERLEDATTYGQQQSRSHVAYQGEGDWIWNNYPPFKVYQNSTFLGDFEAFHEAAAYAKKFASSYIYLRGKEGYIWTNTISPKEKVEIQAPLISQLPELPRGCEVTSLAMLLNYGGISVDKMTLAREIKKDPTPYRRINGKIHYGNPNDGFIGDMYSFRNPGLGVYHRPIRELMEVYMPGQTVDLTGSDFEEVLYFLQQGTPVWVIHNTNFARLGPEHFQTWETPTGTIQITYKEHSVLVTGYDQEYIFFNDPLTNSRRRVRKAPFVAGWIQMGSQAITYVMDS